MLRPKKVRIHGVGHKGEDLENINYVSVRNSPSTVNVMIDVEPITVVIGEDHTYRLEDYGSKGQGKVLVISRKS